SSQIQWTSSRDGALGTGATISPSTLTTGTHIITAGATDSDSLHGQAQVSIRVRDANVAPVVTISAPADGASVPAGSTVTLGATATDDFDGNVTSRIQWASSRDGALGGGGTRTVMLSEGSHVLTASVTDTDGATGSAQVRLTVTATAPVVTITGPADGTTVFAGTSLAFSGTANDATDGNLAASLRWSSDRDGLIGSGASFATTRLSAGTHPISASATDRDGGITTATITINVVPATVTFAAVADTYVDASKATTVFGTATSIAGLSSPAKIAFLRFAVAGVGNLKVQQAKLRLTAVAASNSGGVLKSLTNGTWSEASTNYNTRPTVDGPTLATQGSVAAKQVVDLDVTGSVT